MNTRGPKKRGIAVTGSWLPLPLDFLRSRACAEMSPHAAKLLFDLLAMLGPNASRNGDLCLTPKAMAVRGWSSKSSLASAIDELQEHGLIAQTRAGRLDCALWACTLFPIDCDISKLDAGPGSYRTTDWMRGGELANPPTETHGAEWRRARKGVATGTRKIKKTDFRVPPRDDAPTKRPGAELSLPKNEANFPISSRPGVPI